MEITTLIVWIMIIISLIPIAVSIIISFIFEYTNWNLGDFIEDNHMYLFPIGASMCIITWIVSLINFIYVNI